MAHAAAQLKKARSEMDQPPDLKALEKARERRRRSRERAERRRKVPHKIHPPLHSLLLPDHHVFTGGTLNLQSPLRLIFIFIKCHFTP